MKKLYYFTLLCVLLFNIMDICIIILILQPPPLTIRELPWRNIWLSDNPVEVLNEHLSLLVGRYVPTKVIRVRNKNKSWFDDQCRHAFSLKQEAHLRWTRDCSRVNWEEFVHCQVRANEAKRQFSDRNRDVLMNVQSPHKRWSSLKSAMFGSSSSLPPLVSEGGGLVCESVGKADLLSDHFDSKQSRETIDLPLTCHLSPSLTTFAFRSSEVRRLLLDLEVWVPVMHFFVCPMHCRVHWRMGRRLGSCRLTSVQLLIGSTVWAFSISSALRVLEVLSCLY